MRTFGQKLLRITDRTPGKAYNETIADLIDALHEIEFRAEESEQERLARRAIEKFEEAAMAFNKCITFKPEEHVL